MREEFILLGKFVKQRGAGDKRLKIHTSYSEPRGSYEYSE